MRRRPWLSFTILLLLCFSFNAVSGARNHHSSAILVATVYCDTSCFRQRPSKSTHFISGATVAVECGGDRMKSFREEVKTNEKGEFEAKLPVSIGENVDRIKSCSAKLVSSGDPQCAVAATAATSSEIRFMSKKAGTDVFSAGVFTFKPESCSQQDFVGKGFLPPIGDWILPPFPDLPPFPPLPPLPPFPPFPPLPGMPPPSPPPPPSLPIPLPPLPDPKPDPIPDPIPDIPIPDPKPEPKPDPIPDPIPDIPIPDPIPDPIPGSPVRPASNRPHQKTTP